MTKYYRVEIRIAGERWINAGRYSDSDDRMKAYYDTPEEAEADRVRMHSDCHSRVSEIDTIPVRYRATVVYPDKIRNLVLSADAERVSNDMLEIVKVHGEDAYTERYEAGKLVPERFCEVLSNDTV